jgi:hypothetical protein
LFWGQERTVSNRQLLSTDVYLGLIYYAFRGYFQGQPYIPLPSFISGVRVQSLVFCAVLFWPLFVFSPFYFWALYFWALYFEHCISEHCILLSFFKLTAFLYLQTFINEYIRKHIKDDKRHLQFAGKHNMYLVIDLFWFDLILIVFSATFSNISTIS